MTTEGRGVWAATMAPAPSRARTVMSRSDAFIGTSSLGLGRSPDCLQILIGSASKNNPRPFAPAVSEPDPEMSDRQLELHSISGAAVPDPPRQLAISQRDRVQKIEKGAA